MSTGVMVLTGLAWAVVAMVPASVMVYHTVHRDSPIGYAFILMAGASMFGFSWAVHL